MGTFKGKVTSVGEAITFSCYFFKVECTSVTLQHDVNFQTTRLNAWPHKYNAITMFHVNPSFLMILLAVIARLQ